MELDSLEDWLQREQMERRMGDSLLKWLGFNKLPLLRIKHKVWRKQLTCTTRQLKLWADKAKQRTDLEMLDGTDVVRVAEAVAVRRAGATEVGAAAEVEADAGTEAEADVDTEVEVMSWC
jgi:hypothetical protein